MKSLESSVFAESALIDKETGRIFWEGGEASTLQASVGPKLEQFGLNHISSALLSVILWLAVFGWISAWVERNLSDLINRGIPNAFLRGIVALSHWTFKRVPRFDKTFTLGVYSIYLLEAFFSGTRRYLSNTVSGTDGIEKHLESLREASPVITWKIRSYHYENRPLFVPLIALHALVSAFFPPKKRHALSYDREEPLRTFKRKVISGDVEEKYKYGKCMDRTIAGVWRRATSVQHPAPFAKIVLSKLVLLSDGSAREDYFGQQAAFVREHGGKDSFAEFSTRIEVKKFRPRMLAVRPYKHKSGKFFSLAIFWILTALLCSFPYRVWFAGHADELRVTVVKETTALNPTQRVRSWFSGSPPKSTNMDEIDDEENFREFMRQMHLYGHNETHAIESPVEIHMNTTNVEPVDTFHGNATDALAADTQSLYEEKMVENANTTRFDDEVEDALEKLAKVDNESNQ